MRKSFLPLLLSLVLLCNFPLHGLAQQKAIIGVVSNAAGQELPGVTISIRGSARAATTDANGKFNIEAATGNVLEISHVGYETQTMTLKDEIELSIVLNPSTDNLEEVVVTAMDIKRNARSLGYSTQSVSGDDIKESQRENFLNSLQGRVAGLTLDQTSGIAGASSAIVLRGFNSLSLSNSPLFVVDGVILDNTTMSETSSGGATNGLASDRPNRQSDYQNRIADINPNDIENVTVLKGPEATALYGSQASSGAIIITTKKATSNKLAVQYDNSFRMQKVVRYPETLDDYSNGENGNPSRSFRRYGPKYSDTTELFDNLKNFFRTGFAQTHNLGADFGFGESKFRVSGSFFDQKGVVPNNDFRRYNFRISNTTYFWKKKIDITPSFAYIKSDNNKVLRSSGSFLLGLLTWPANNDIRNFQNDLGDKLDLFDNSDANAEFDNPLWNVYHNFGNDKTDRKTYTFGINIRPFDFLSLAGRFGYDTYDMNGFLFFHPSSFYVTKASGGSLDNYWRKYKGYNHTITATANKDVFKGLNIKVMAGTMWQDYRTDMFAVYGTNIVDSVGSATNIQGGNGQMYKDGNIISDQDLKAIMGNYMDSSVTRQSTRLRLNRNKFGEYNYVQQRQLAYFGEVGLSYKNYLFLNYTHRFEQSSTLPVKNRNYNYPGASVSIILSDIIPGIKRDFLNYWKLRGSRATTARLNSPYSTQSVFVDNLASGGGYSYGFYNNNPDLAPEKQSTFELGTELRLLKNKLSLDFTYYNTLNKGQIVENFRLSYATGFVLNTQNAGSTRNKGVEVVLSYNLLKTNDLNWDMMFNFNRMRNKVVELPKNVAEYYIADTWLYTARAGLVLGGPTTSLTGSTYKRNNNSQILIDPTNGVPILDAAFKVIGDRNADFTTGWTNSIRYKNWRLNMLWDLKVGGDIFNANARYMTIYGSYPGTIDRYEPRVIEGVLQDGKENTDNPTKNSITVIPAYNSTTFYLPPDEEFIEKDVNYFRLRDITLSYTFNNNLIRGVKSLSAFVTGNDLILITNYTGADPAVNGNSAGGRGVGAFGYDYGTLSSPMQVNFGIRAAF